MMALLLADAADEPVDAMRVAKLLLVHDIVEIDAGDTFVYDADGLGSKAERERAAADRLFALLPDGQGDELHDYWLEFEHGASAEARFARSLDRLQPLLLNHASAGKAWREHGITAEQVRAVNSTIGDGSAVLWELAQRIIDEPSRAGGCRRPAVRLSHRFRSVPRWSALGAGLAAAWRSRPVDPRLRRHHRPLGRALARPPPRPALLRLVERSRPRAALDRARRVARRTTR
jgi:putative hydrolase of HD superfamily